MANEPRIPMDVLELFREWGRSGGSKGGKLSASRMTKAQRSERARLAGLASGKARAKKAKAKGKA